MVAAATLFSAPSAGSINAADRSVLLLGVTTSTENSGLLDHVLRAFHEQHAIEIRAVTAGTGAILKMASRGDLGAVLVHSPEDEAAFIASGYGTERKAVMHNRFVIVGPRADPAGIKGKPDAVSAFSAIAEHRARFLSRGDQSGTHKAELRLWHALGIDPGGGQSAEGWYRESGSGQGATLNIAVNLDAYCLIDEATWAGFRNRGDLVMLFDQEDPMMNNPYSIILIDPKRHQRDDHASAVIFADWLISEQGRRAISSFKVDGRSLFRTDGEGSWSSNGKSQT